MVNPLGINALGMYIDDRLGFVQWIAQSKPAAVLVMDTPEIAQSIRGLSPQSIVIHRTYNQNDNHWEDILTPCQWLDAHASFAKNGVLLAVFNEPSPGNIPKFLNWLVELMTLASRANIVLVVANFSVGNPDEKLIKSGTYDALLKALSISHHYLGLHEYFRVNPIEEPYLIGRYKLWQARADVLGIQRPKIIITEHGRDLGGGKNDGWRGQNWSEDFYFLLLSQAQQVYGNIPVCIFCYGHGAGNSWSSFDIEHAETLKKLITQYGADHPMTQTTKVPIPTDNPVSATVSIIPGSYINIRDNPNGNDIGDLRVGDEVTYFPQSPSDGSVYVHSKIVNGWVNMQGGAVVFTISMPSTGYIISSTQYQDLLDVYAKLGNIVKGVTTPPSASGGF